MSAEAWEGFRHAIVRIEFDHGPMVLAPEPAGSVGEFPFVQPVFIVTAFNPNGAPAAPDHNQRADRELEATFVNMETLRTVGSSPDGDHREAGYLVVTLGDAIANTVGRRFGQAAYYKWSADELRIVALDGTDDIVSGWSLTPSP